MKKKLKLKMKLKTKQGGHLIMSSHELAKNE